ncbi:hypothetical protein FACS1894211_04170 [Clostridia bacterium]|nr:hypothetical protein FACS1894211_04170 [Clostridia bacterium]
MFPFFNGFGGGCGYGCCGGGFGGWGFGGPCGKCGHCCYCNRNALMLQAAWLAASCCQCGRGAVGGGFNDFNKNFDLGQGAGFGGGFGKLLHNGRGGERKKETPPEDLRGRRDNYPYR